MADTIVNIKNLVIRSENARVTLQLREMKKSYADLIGENRKLFL